VSVIYFGGCKKVGGVKKLILCFSHFPGVSKYFPNRKFVLALALVLVLVVIMSSSVVGQLLINHISLPEDICEEIKSYCFYELVTGKTRILKKEILGKIKKSRNQETSPMCSRASFNYGEQLFFFYLEGWPYHQIMFCTTCGNYIDFSNFDNQVNASPNVKCTCPGIMAIDEELDPHLLWLNENIPNPDVLFVLFD